MRRKPKETKEEKVTGEFFPVSPKDLKYSIEKEHKSSDFDTLMEIEKKKKKGSPKKKTTSKKGFKREFKKTKLDPKDFKTPKLKLKKDGYELLVTEKPQAALKIASALGKSTKKTINGIPYYEVKRKKEKIVVACAVGHLFTLTHKGSTSQGPIFDLMWVPNYFVRKNDFSKKYYQALSSLIKNAKSITISTDYDIEGEVIGLNIFRFIGGQTDAKRMRFSSLTEKEINQAYENQSDSIDWGQAIAGETRHYLDWFYGINLSRSLMNSLKSVGKFKLISIGRVQGPTLKIIVEKEKEISEFKEKKYWQIFINLEKPKIELVHNKDIFKKSELKKFENLTGKTGIAETKKIEKRVPPNPPFNLTTLQIESYKHFGINPIKTLEIAQSLYLGGLISYPRTSSQKLPPSINYKEILKNLSKRYSVEKLIIREKPVEGRKSDSAHPSIYPTGEIPNQKMLNEDEKKIYDLIVRRFLSLFAEDAIVENKTINVRVGGLLFLKKGYSIKKESWLGIYPSKIKEKEVPDLEGEVKIINSRIEEKETQPPKRYSPASLISLLEKKNLGTKGTRASILETLYGRGYVDGQSIKATPLGISLIETLKKYSPIIIDEKLTRDFEKEMESIQNSKKDQISKKEKILDKAKKSIIEITKEFEKKQEKVGEEISKANDEYRKQQKEENKLETICPKCKKGNLSISYSKKTRRYFIACNAYPDCKNTYSLPPNGLIKKTKEICEECGFQKMMLIRKGKRPWIFCFNPECPLNKERVEAYKNKQENEQNSNPKILI
ncbi:DNA topoisomerase I [Patescibacteria group bacterium]|nr:DNA topoisomerase I [Patescibacteria group bacterium]